jgi:uncharacterized protein YpuA (DUF1002 family)
MVFFKGVLRMNYKIQKIIVALIIIMLLVLGACKTVPAETITTTVTQPATTVTTTVTQPATTVTTTITQLATTATIPTTTVQSTEQTEVITSPDGKVQILEPYLTYYSSSWIVVGGTIKNVSSSPVSAEINVELYDFSGSLLDTIVKTVNSLEPGETRDFQITGYGKCTNASSYKISVSTVD